MTGAGARDWSAQPRPGDAFASGWQVIGPADVDAFAQATGDRHPQHLDPEWAARGPFGGRVVSGLQVLACAFGLVELDPERVVALRRLRDVTFKRPARVGEAVGVRGEVVGVVAAGPELALVTLAWRVVDRDEATLARARVDLLWRVQVAA